MGNSSQSSSSREHNLKHGFKNMKNMSLANLLKNMTVTQGNITKDYLIKIPPMGKSEIGEIREVIHKNLKRRNILKILYLNMFSDKEIQMILNEIKISQKLSHPNVLEMMEYNYDNQNIYIIMEYFQGGRD